MARRKVFLGFIATGAAILSLSVGLSNIAEDNVGVVDDIFGTKSSKVVNIEEEGVDPESYYNYFSTYSTPEEYARAHKNFYERVQAEGSTLLKNDGVLPLRDNQKNVTLVGKGAYKSVLGGQMGSSAQNPFSRVTDDSIDEFRQVDLQNALTQAGYTLNPTMKAAYETINRGISTISGGFGMINESAAPYYKFNINEVTQDELETQSAGITQTRFTGYETAIVVLARINSEGRDYLPGLDGVYVDENTYGTDGQVTGYAGNTGATDPLGLSDDERNMINMAKQNADRVIVLINSNSPMEIPEVAADRGVNAIMWIGTTGDYGMHAIPKLLDGTYNPSGKLPDTYASDASVSPAAQNWGIYSYSNLDEIATTAEDQITNTWSGDVCTWTAVSADNLRASAYTVYQEGIYIGYRYYETRYYDSVMNPSSKASSAVGTKEGATSWKYEDEVIWPFGYGLSYTRFNQELQNVEYIRGSEKIIRATVKVTNVGSLPGKDVVQLYAALPDTPTSYEKSAIQLIGYEKTNELAPGASTTITIVADAQDITSYDNTLLHDNVVGGYVLEGGDYHFAIGNGAHEAINNVLAFKGKTIADGMDVNGQASRAKKLVLERDETTFNRTKATSTIVQNQLDNADLNYYLSEDEHITYLSRQDWEGTFPTRQYLSANEEMIKELRNKLYKIKTTDNVTVKWGSTDTSYNLADLKGIDWDNDMWDDFVNQITLENAIAIIAVGGNTTWTIDEIANPRNRQADGPNGFSSFGLGGGYTYAVSEGGKYHLSPESVWVGYKAAAPNAPVIAATFSKTIHRSWGELIGNQSIWNGGATIWAGGANLHRAPYEGRTHEYFSEDACLSAYALDLMVEGARDFGCLIGPKHFAFNAIEYNRYGLSEFMTEQTARETELRSFQKTYESGHCLATMTAFNRIGCSNLNGHVGLMQNILRKEWGYKGLISTDMVNGQNYFLPGECIIGGVTMMANGRGAKTDLRVEWGDYVAERVANDQFFNEHLHLNMKYQWYSYAHSNLLNGMSSNYKVVQVMTSWRAGLLISEVSSSVVLTAMTALYVLDVILKRRKA